MIDVVLGETTFCESDTFILAGAPIRQLVVDEVNLANRIAVFFPILRLNLGDRFGPLLETRRDDRNVNVSVRSQQLRVTRHPTESRREHRRVAVVEISLLNLQPRLINWGDGAAGSRIVEHRRLQTGCRCRHHGEYSEQRRRR